MYVEPTLELYAQESVPLLRLLGYSQQMVNVSRHKPSSILSDSETMPNDCFQDHRSSISDHPILSKAEVVTGKIRRGFIQAVKKR